MARRLNYLRGHACVIDTLDGTLSGVIVSAVPTGDGFALHYLFAGRLAAISFADISSVSIGAKVTPDSPPETPMIVPTDSHRGGAIPFASSSRSVIR